MAKQAFWLFGILVGLWACKADELQIGDDPLADGGIDLGVTGGVPVGTGGTIGGTGGAIGGTGGAIGGTSGIPGSGGITPPPSNSKCGDGLIESDEQCDDGNNVAFDGCNGLCQVEEGFVCAVPGQPCVLVVICGNAIVSSTETCDDGNTVGGDGCSADCMTIERGWICPAPGKACRPRCGDGLIVGGETCDDGNSVSGDGCSSTCRVEPGASCPSAGRPCVFASCGNGKLEAGEVCDCGADPGHLPAGCPSINGILFGDGRGCSEACTREPVCVDATGKTQACATACGNGNVDPGEQCDDGNLTSGDGCSSNCLLETGYRCATTATSGEATCSTGNGQCLRLPVLYRDFQPENAASGGHPDFFFLGARYGTSRWPTTVCVPNSAGPAHGSDATKRCWGIAADSLIKGKPEAGTTTTCDCQFSDWSIANSALIPGGYSQAGNDSPLSDGNGGFLADSAGSVIRVTGAAGVSDGILIGYTATSPGAPIFAGKVPAYKDASSFAQWYSDDASVNTTFASVLEMKAIGTGVYQYGSQVHLADGGFFPLDVLNPSQATLCNLWPYWNHGDGTPFWANCVGDQHYLPPHVTAADCTGSLALGCWIKGVTGVRHDSYFTFETRYHFTYDGATGLSLSIYGDDDLFVYINGILVLDLGGVHQPLPGKVTIAGSPGDAHSTEGGCLDSAGNITGTSAGSTACSPTGGPPAASSDDFRDRTVKLGLETGKTYEMAIFGADRHPPESNFQLTLMGNSAKRSECVPSCGDGVVVPGEQCDEGAANNDSSYGGCDTHCQFGPRCGDGVVNGPEQCDLGAGNGQSGTGCTLACSKVHYCGDGIADGTMGEECDLGAQNGKAGSRCTSDCRLAPL